MKNELTISEIRYIRGLLAVKTDREIALLLNKPVELITDQIAKMCGIERKPKRPRQTEAAAAESPASVIEPARLPDPLPVLPEASSIETPVKKPITKEQKQILRDNKKAEKERQVEKIRKKQTTYAQLMEHRKIRKDKFEKSILPNRELNESDKIPIRLNAKTIVYVKPGTDIEKLKKQYNIC